jgi:hypothetical protein
MVKKNNLKQKAMYYSIVFFSLLCTASTCKKDKDCPEGSHSTIAIRNNSSITVNWIFDDNPNDYIWTVNGDYPRASDRLISPNSTYQVAIGLEKCWEYYYQNSHSEYYFIFNHDTVQALGWQKISGTNRGLLKRVKVDLIYLQNNNFTITYP